MNLTQYFYMASTGGIAEMLEHQLDCKPEIKCSMCTDQKLRFQQMLVLE